MSKVIIFTAGAVPTADEKTFIERVKRQLLGPAGSGPIPSNGHEVVVRSAFGITADSDGNMAYGSGLLETCDYIAEESAGVAPDAASFPYNGKTLYDPAAPPNLNGEATQAVVVDGQVIPTTGAAATVTLTIAGGVITAAVAA